PTHTLSLHDALPICDALQANEELRRKLANFLKERGIDGDRIQASRFSSTQKHGVFSEKVKSHRVDNVIKVTVQSEQEFQGAAGRSEEHTSELQSRGQ